MGSIAGLAEDNLGRTTAICDIGGLQYYRKIWPGTWLCWITLAKPFCQIYNPVKVEITQAARRPLVSADALHGRRDEQIVPISHWSEYCQRGAPPDRRSIPQAWVVLLDVEPEEIFSFCHQRTYQGPFWGFLTRRLEIARKWRLMAQDRYWRRQAGGQPAIQDKIILVSSGIRIIGWHVRVGIIYGFR